MSPSPNLALPLLAPSQAQKHVTHNEALIVLDALVQLSVQSRTQDAPPAVPEEGARYLVTETPEGSWAGHPGELASWDGQEWRFLQPRPGWQAYVADENGLVLFDGTGWSAAAFSPSTLSELDGLGVKIDWDTANRLAVASRASLFTHAGAGHQMKVNKNAAGDTGALLFQTGFSGRARLHGQKLVFFLSQRHGGGTRQPVIFAQFSQLCRLQRGRLSKCILSGECQRTALYLDGQRSDQDKRRRRDVSAWKYCRVFDLWRTISLAKDTSG